MTVKELVIQLLAANASDAIVSIAPNSQGEVVLLTKTPNTVELAGRDKVMYGTGKPDY